MLDAADVAVADADLIAVVVEDVDAGVTESDVGGGGGGVDHAGFHAEGVAAALVDEAVVGSLEFKHGVLAEFVVAAEREGAAIFHLRAVHEGEGVDVVAGVFRHGVGDGAGDERRITHRVIVLRVDDIALEVAEGETDGIIEEGLGVVEAAAGFQAACRTGAGAGHFAEAKHFTIGGEREGGAEAPAFLLKSIFRDGVDHAARRGCHPRRRCLENFNGLDVGNRRGAELEGAAGGVGAAGARAWRGAGGSGDLAVESEERRFWVLAAHGDGAGVGVGEVDLQAGHVAEKFADIAVGHDAEGVGGDRLDEHVGFFLLVDRGGVALGLGGDGEGTEFVDPRGEREILSGLGAGGDGHATFLGVEAGVGDDEIVGTGSETGERIRAVAIGEDRAVGAVDLDLGAIKEKTRALIRNGACNRARAGLCAEAGGSEGKREEAEQPGGAGARPRGN